ncbi:hypothetical protein [Roseivirga sp. UBA1976]|uniref:hypothetical protein n=1 Tax=Roseivirga sp. UBA1976 TaxID=1947386 RepID=UPI00257E2B5D|nr:hypothetical protein [Roseivirga sp. UBA1976]MEC7755637.1 hypothetical protein [Bacteroidota bacterium]|tara:strand:- start:62 stop:385 length:324 start_codon:yes stop_codon:yes gene_type:complete
MENQKTLPQEVAGELLSPYSDLIENVKENIFMNNTMTPEERQELNLWGVLGNASWLCAGGAWPNVGYLTSDFIEGLRLIVSKCGALLDDHELEQFKRFVVLTEKALS